MQWISPSIRFCSNQFTRCDQPTCEVGCSGRADESYVRERCLYMLAGRHFPPTSFSLRTLRRFFATSAVKSFLLTQAAIKANRGAPSKLCFERFWSQEKAPP